MPKKTNKKQQIIDMWWGNPNMNETEIAKRVGVSRQYVWRVLRDFVRKSVKNAK